MSNMKNKKKLTSVLVAFLLVFVIGAAFAFTPGTLSVGGVVSFQYEYVVWGEAEAAQNAVLGPSTANIVSARGRTAQHIAWTMEFRTPGTHTLTATPENRSGMAANLTVLASAGWGTHAEDPVEPDSEFSLGAFVLGTRNTTWGLTIDIDPNPVQTIAGGSVGTPTQGDPYTITVVWDGTLPPGFDPEEQNPGITFWLELSYQGYIPGP